MVAAMQTGPETNAVAIRPAGPDDSHALWSWRNDERTRAMSIVADPVSWEDHTIWFERSLLNPRRHIYLGWAGGRDRVGMCRFDLDEAGEVAEVSINLNPCFRGQGFGRPMLAGAVATFLKKHPVRLLATIKPDNPGSIRVFERCGFTRRSDEGGVARFELPAGSGVHLQMLGDR